MNRLNEERKQVPGEEKKLFRDDAEKQLKHELGDKYGELNEMVETMKNNLVKVAQQAKLAVPLPIKMQHPYQYSKWDSIHEPYNIVENILGDNQTVYKGLTPEFDFNLSDHQEHYISEVLIWPGDCGPNEVELYVGNQNGW